MKVGDVYKVINMHNCGNTNIEIGEEVVLVQINDGLFPYFKKNNNKKMFFGIVPMNEIAISLTNLKKIVR